ncbi:MAG: sensor histidine kinase [Microthrixaceae bacterium]
MNGPIVGTDDGSAGDPTRFLPPLRGDLAAAKEIEVDDEEDFTAEHVALVVPPVDHDVSRHLRRLVVSWAMLADFSFSDLLLYVPLPHGQDQGRRFLVVNQIRPNTGQTLFEEDVVGRTVDDEQRPLVALAAGDGRIHDDVVDSEWLGQSVKVTAVPVSHHGEVVAVMARESPLALARPPGDLARTYLEIFDRLAAMVAAGEFPFADEEVLSAGGPRVGDGVLLVDPTGRVTFASPNAVSALRRLGVSGAILGELVSNFGQAGDGVFRSFLSRLPAIEDLDHGETTVVSRSIPLLSAGRVDGAVVLMRDVSELRSRDRLLISKDATIREIHHRVKNNLQTISSLLRLQGRRLQEPTAKAAIDESVRRIGSIALVHETLSRGVAADEVDLDEIVRPLVRMVEEGLTSPERPVRFGISGSGGDLGSPQATSLAVVLTELLQNVMDHAYPPGTLERGTAGQVTIALSHDDSTVEVVVRDDGVGAPGGFDPNGSSLGMSIVQGLVADLGGRITFGVAGGPPQREGTQVVLQVPRKAPE